MMNEASSKKQEPEQGMSEGEGRAGSTVCINCYDDGTYDVYAGPLKPASEAEYPDGLFGMESLDDALKAVIALKQSSKDFQSAEHDDMMNAFAGKDEETSKPAMAGGY